MKCGHCKNDFEEREIDEHHCHPRFMDNPRGDGMKVDLCKKCHNILHLKLPTILWRHLNGAEKAIVINEVYRYSKKYGGLSDGRNS